MPMIGGEMAAENAATDGCAAGGAYDLGWVMDWLYGDAALPPTPLRPVEPSRPRFRTGYAADVPDGSAPTRPSPARRGARPPRTARQMALL